MGFRDTIAPSESIDQRVQKLERRFQGGLPSGFSWVVTLNSLGEETLQIVHDQTGRVVWEGF